MKYRDKSFTTHQPRVIYDQARGSQSLFGDANGNPIQYIHYAPYGEQIANQQTIGYDERFKFTGKERDWETGYDYFGARFYDSQKGFWNSVDPLADKYPGNTPYLYCNGNPIVRIDPDGRADYYDVDGNHLCNDGIDDRKVFQQSDNGDIQFGAYSFLFSYVGEVDKISLLYEGSMVDGKNQSAGNLIVSQYVGDKVFNQIFAAVSGNKNAYTLQNGEYSCSLFRYRSPSEGNGGYYNNGYGFSINLNPSFTTMRTYLRIHPDGGKQGTLGCIGLSGESKELLQFVRMVTPFIPTDSKNTSVLLNVVIADNPGCFKAADKTTPALFR